MSTMDMDMDDMMRRRPLEDAPRSPSMMDDGPPMGVLVDEPTVKITRRGDSAIVDFAPGMDRTSLDDSDEHIENIAEWLDQHVAGEIVERVIDQVDVDLQSRKPWTERVDQAMELLGLRNRPTEELPFEGASAVTYPLIAEACVQFQARAIEEVFPSDGPCKTKVVGKRSREIEEQADRVAAHMNFQMMEEDRAYFWHVDQMLFWLPLFGSAFKKTYYDPTQKMVISRLIAPGDFIVPYLATDLHTTPRATHRMIKTRSQMERLMASGYYRTVELFKSDALATATDIDSTREMQDKADDRTPATHVDDDSYTLYEMSCDLEIDEDQDRFFGADSEDRFPLPYIVTVEKDTRQLLAVRRNWKEGDETFERRRWVTHYKYLPGLGFYGFGLLHLIGSLSESATGALRALLDGAAFANMQGGFVSEDAQLAEGESHMEPGVYKRVKMSAEELARAFYTPPFKEPSPALASLFNLLVDAGRRFASITEEMVGDASNTGPVGTTIALIEQSSKVFSGVHRRLHVAQGEELNLRAELNAEFLPAEYPYEVEGESRIIMRSDYDAKVDVIPVSDPNIFSSAQRIAQGQALLDLAERFPSEIDLTEAVERFLRAIKVPDYEMLMRSGSKVRRDAVSENMLLMVGKPVKAFAEQDHESHVQAHMAMMQAVNDEARQIVGMAVQAHLAEHYAFMYYNAVNAQLGGALPPPTWMDGDSDEEIPIEADYVISQAATQVQIPQLMPPTPGSPDAEAIRAQAEEQRKTEQFQRDQQMREAEFAAEEERKQRAFDAEMARKDQASEEDLNRKLAAAMTDEERRDLSLQREQMRRDAQARAEARNGKKGAK